MNGETISDCPLCGSKCVKGLTLISCKDYTLEKDACTYLADDLCHEAICSAIPKWIKIEPGCKMPNEYQAILITDGVHVAAVEHTELEWWVDDIEEMEMPPTNWMPMPQPPTKE